MKKDKERKENQKGGSSPKPKRGHPIEEGLHRYDTRQDGGCNACLYAGTAEKESAVYEEKMNPGEIEMEMKIPGFRLQADLTWVRESLGWILGWAPYYWHRFEWRRGRHCYIQRIDSDPLHGGLPGRVLRGWCVYCGDTRPRSHYVTQNLGNNVTVRLGPI